MSQIPTFTTVNRHNLSTLQLAIKHSVANASFVALDTEFTGLGDKKKTRSANIEDRYTALRTVAQDHAIIAFGISIFTRQAQPNGSKSKSSKTKNNAVGEYTVSNYQFSMLATMEHAVDPQSLSFLVVNGFDFNDQILNGIPYCRGDALKVNFKINFSLRLSQRILILSITPQCATSLAP